MFGTKKKTTVNSQQGFGVWGQQQQVGKQPLFQQQSVAVPSQPAVANWPNNFKTKAVDTKPPQQTSFWNQPNNNNNNNNNNLFQPLNNNIGPVASKASLFPVKEAGAQFGFQQLQQQQLLQQQQQRQPLFREPASQQQQPLFQGLAAKTEPVSPPLFFQNLVAGHASPPLFQPAAVAALLNPHAQAQHPAFCDNCKTGQQITGVRHKCAMCPNYDLCDKCIDTGCHPEGHLFLRVTKPDLCNKIPMLFNRELSKHPGVCCSGCQQAVVGWRYDCTVCYVSLCEACEGLGKHDVTHPRVKTSHFSAPKPEDAARAAKCFECKP